MKIKPILPFLAVVAAATATAAPISPECALGRLEASRSLKAKSGAAPRLLREWTAPDGLPSMYLFSYSGSEGFMLLAADDAVAPMLGYSETGSFADDADMPTGLKAYLGYYSHQIAGARHLPALQPVSAPATRADGRPAIEPMLKTTWDQTSPFNGECPIVNGWPCVTGCVATAMAQVMKYWEYPQSGTGSISYVPPAIGEEISMNFSETVFEWENMQNSYKGGAGSVSKRAVAMLMKACGYSVKMKYSSGESGAYSRDIPSALSTYFGYDKGVERKQRNAFSQQDWDALIYKELSTTGPVIYSGDSSYGGHCFVCDGYDGNGLYHINWGWSGLSDGYFQLGELTPSSIGTGGHYGGYNMAQDAIVGIMPPVGRLTLDKIEIDNAADDSGNVKGWGYTYRLNDFSNILLSVQLRVAGGHISSPLYVDIYETDPDTKKNGRKVVETTFMEPLNAGEGNVTCTTSVRMDSFNPSQLYTLTVAYDLKGERTIIGTIRLAASSGVEEVGADLSDLTFLREGDRLTASGGGNVELALFGLDGSLMAKAAGAAPAIELHSFAPGLYIARATDAQGRSRTVKLLLK